MSVVLGYFDSPTGSHTLARESFQLCTGLTGSHRNRAGARSSFKPSGESWRTWSSEKQGTKLAAAPMGRSHLEKQMGLSGYNLLNLQLNGVSHSDELERPIYAVKDILKALGRALLILGVGFSLSPPASARMVAPSVSEVSSGGFRGSAIDGVKIMKEPNKNVDALYPRTDASHECDELNNPRDHSTLNDVDTSETPGERFRLSEAFWIGVPTVEGSLLYRLKAQLEMNPGDSRALEALLQAVLEQQDMLRALTVVETLLETQPDNWHWKLLKARTHESLGELLMAKQEYEELLSLHPLSARFLQGLVMLLNKVGEQTQGLELIQNSLNQALSEGKDLEARDLGVLLSQFYIQLGNFEDALHHLSSMIEQDPNDYRPYLCQESRLPSEFVLPYHYAISSTMDDVRVVALHTERQDFTHLSTFVLWTMRDTSTILGVQEDELRRWSQGMIDENLQYPELDISSLQIQYKQLHDSDPDPSWYGIGLWAYGL